MTTPVNDPGQLATGLVERFLTAVGTGDLASARDCLAPGVTMIFPGGRRYGELAELAAASRERYLWVDKERDEYRASVHADGTVTVVSIGTLFGENLHGVRFQGVRYIDVFEVREGAITQQRVWNDLAETGVLEATPGGEAASVQPVAGDDA